jgi:hypothetical protein
MQLNPSHFFGLFLVMGLTIILSFLVLAGEVVFRVISDTKKVGSGVMLPIIYGIHPRQSGGRLFCFASRLGV